MHTGNCNCAVMARNLNHNGQIADLNYNDICMFNYNFPIMAVTPSTTTDILKFVYIFPVHYDLMMLVSSDIQQQKYSTSKINLLKTKRNLLYIRNQSVPRCKHFPPWL